MKRTQMIAGFLFLAFASTAHAAGQIAADESAVNAACTAEASQAGCGSETAGKGLVKCIHAYKKAQKKAFQISPGCKSAIRAFIGDVKAKKAAGGTAVPATATAPAASPAGH